MRKLAFILAVFPTFACAAFADTPKILPQQLQNDPLTQRPMPRSIWAISGAGDATHLQSGLSCPAELGSFRKLNLMAYDRGGFDVSCNYQNDRRSLITVYLTRRHGQAIADDFAEAERELVTATPQATPLPDSQQVEIDRTRSWQRIVYSEHDGAMHSGIWISDLDGWTLEYRATYALDDEQSVVAEIELLTTNSERTAGQRLALCNKSIAPLRSGALVTDKDRISEYSIMSGIIGGAAQVAANSSAAAARPITWCAEGLVPDPQSSVLMWRGVFDDGSDASADRVTLMTMGEPPELISAPDPDANLILAELKGKGQPAMPLWSVTQVEGDTTWFFAYYDGRPDGNALSTLMQGIEAQTIKSLGGYSRDGKKITIRVPDAK